MCAPNATRRSIASCTPEGGAPVARNMPMNANRVSISSSTLRGVLALVTISQGVYFWQISNCELAES